MPNMSFDFTGRSAIVTGAARGIGLAIARHFHAAGATVFMVDLDETALTEAASEIGAIAVAADITRSADADAVRLYRRRALRPRRHPRQQRRHIA